MARGERAIGEPYSEAYNNAYIQYHHTPGKHFRNVHVRKSKNGFFLAHTHTHHITHIYLEGQTTDGRKQQRTALAQILRVGVLCMHYGA